MFAPAHLNSLTRDRPPPSKLGPEQGGGAGGNSRRGSNLVWPDPGDPNSICLMKSGVLSHFSAAPSPPPLWRSSPQASLETVAKVAKRTLSPVLRTESWSMRSRPGAMQGSPLRLRQLPPEGAGGLRGAASHLLLFRHLLPTHLPRPDKMCPSRGHERAGWMSAS